MAGVFAVGPPQTPITGQLNAFLEYVNNSKHEIHIAHYSPRKAMVIRHAIGLLTILIRITFLRLSGKISVVYITTGRTKISLVRDSSIIIIASIFGMKIINHLHGADFLSFRKSSRLLRPIIDFVYCRIDHHIVLTERMEEQYSYYKKSEISVVSNFTNVNPASGPKRPKDGEPVKLLYLSNIMRSKGPIEAIQAIKLFPPKTQVELHIAGEVLGDHLLDAEQMSKELQSHLRDVRITYHGPIYGNKKIEILANSHIFVLPTYYPTEAQPLAILDAMASGCAIIATKHNYLPDFLFEEFSILVEPESFSALFLACSSLVENKCKLMQMSIRAIEEAKKYSIPKYVEEIDSIVSKTHGTR